MDVSLAPTGELMAAITAVLLVAAAHPNDEIRERALTALRAIFGGNFK
ncbi:hypothetical protein OHU11_03700 [Streptomyces sp. NBC_00257]|nr:MULTISPECIES: hypothetical protein [unclassified Streptomyces]MCX4870846.1 hypothetical protein [Streptomyces sp. NBC_00906]MCX4901586.1 hypothetical protein [Streptomyces sp. NBC_00892]MCX5426829.1 hypothetical protein [Streptomyces sp. NBC_00062]